MKRRWILFVSAGALAAGLWMIYSSRDRRASNEAVVTSEMFWDRWPLTEERGMLACERGGAVIYVAPDGVRYAVNDAARPRYPAIDPIRKIDEGAGAAFTTAVLINEGRRREIFADIVACEQMERSEDECALHMARQFRVTTLEVRQIRDEGFSLNWPPLPVRHVDLLPLVEFGLRLCRS